MTDLLEAAHSEEIRYGSSGWMNMGSVVFTLGLNCEGRFPCVPFVSGVCVEDSAIMESLAGLIFCSSEATPSQDHFHGHW